MRQLTTVITMVLIACLGLAGVGSAQAQQPLRVQGTLVAANCQTQELTVNTGSGTATFPVTNQTAVYVNGALTPVCSLQPFAGAPVTAYLVPENSQFVLGRVDVSAPQNASQAPPASVATSSNASTVGIVLGALFLGGLAYVLLHNSGSQPAPAPDSRYDRWHRQCPDNGDQSWRCR